jgi:hypothetical protein
MEKCTGSGICSLCSKKDECEVTDDDDDGSGLPPQEKWVTPFN